MDLAVDACSLLHAKQLDLDGKLGLLLIENLCTTSSLRLHTTTGVQGEQVAMSLSSTIEAWKQKDLWATHRMPAIRVKATLNKLGKLRPLPGRRDLGLVTLAADLEAALLTHDDPASGAARKLGLVVVDLLDLGDLLSRRDPDFDIDTVFAAWNTAAWRPDDWKGSALATLAARPRRQQLQDHLNGLLAPLP